MLSKYAQTVSILLLILIKRLAKGQREGLEIQILFVHDLKKFNNNFMGFFFKFLDISLKFFSRDIQKKRTEERDELNFAVIRRKDI